MKRRKTRKKFKKRKTLSQCRDIDRNVVTLALRLSPMLRHHRDITPIATSTFQCHDIVSIEEQCCDIAMTLPSMSRHRHGNVVTLHL